MFEYLMSRQQFWLPEASFFTFVFFFCTVTKYVNITNRTDGYPTGDGYGYFHTGGNSTPMQLQHFNLSRLNELNPALSFFKGLFFDQMYAHFNKQKTCSSS